jgi:hypothetical protein
MAGGVNVRTEMSKHLECRGLQSMLVERVRSGDEFILRSESAVTVPSRHREVNDFHV